MRRYPSFIAGLPFQGMGSHPCHVAVALSGVEPGDEVELRRDRCNPHDVNAVAVFFRELHLGYVPARHAGWVAERLDDERAITASVGEVRRHLGQAEGPVVNVELFLDVPLPRRR